MWGRRSGESPPCEFLWAASGTPPVASCAATECSAAWMVNNELRGVGDVVFLVPARRRRAWGRRSDPRARIPPLERGMPCTMGLTAFRASLSVVTHRSGDRRAGGYGPRQCGPSLRECGLRWEPRQMRLPLSDVFHVKHAVFSSVACAAVVERLFVAVRDPGYSPEAAPMAR